ncbi:hypothetical protein [Corynebacterium epidermidicanis]|uniref:Uncharacterized protein n=1 Tax=Corynebacterium epidermidicanis TaxID=1050174 RepID=A0A0G3GP14_9CORY|nr:hypothetical protein [Corynebacterium epidermidicanis]AKK02971.1 hypothetical protein CEPID_05525 [Corynebacterium epidermidicanis]
MIETLDFAEDFEADLTSMRIGPVFRYQLDNSRAEMRRIDAPRDAWLWAVAALSLYSGIHGSAHLNTFGVTRYLHKTGKKQVFSCLTSHILTGVELIMPGGRSFSTMPHRFVGELKESVPPARLYPRKTREEMAEALFRGAVEMAMSDPDGFDIHTAMVNGSIVPNTFDKSPENHDMGQAFETHVNITRMSIEAGGGPRSSWTLYETCLNLWSITHGLATLLANGPSTAYPSTSSTTSSIRYSTARRRASSTAWT